MPEETESSPSAVMSGTGQEVARLLDDRPGQRTVAVTSPDYGLTDHCRKPWRRSADVGVAG